MVGGLIGGLSGGGRFRDDAGGVSPEDVQSTRKCSGTTRENVGNKMHPCVRNHTGGFSFIYSMSLLIGLPVSSQTFSRSAHETGSQCLSLPKDVWLKRFSFLIR